jgi:hypothetical protein
MISIGESDARTTYNTGSCKTGNSVVSAAFAWVCWRTHLVLSRNEGRSRRLGGDLWLVTCQDWHSSVDGKSNNTGVLRMGRR